MKSKPTYLVRPRDFAVFEIDKSNGCYRSYSSRKIKNRQRAYEHFTFENLTTYYDFFPITKKQLPEYLAKHDFEIGLMIWQCRNDGHGEVKGGTREEYIQYLEAVKRYKERTKAN